MYYVYLLQDKNSQTIYVGYTSDLKQRVAHHLAGDGSKFTGRYHDWRLIYYEAYVCECDARDRERKLKQHGQSIRHLKNRLKESLVS
jgi:putative endonuclease